MRVNELAAEKLVHDRHRIVDCDIAKSASLTERQITEVGVTDARRILQQAPEHGLQVAARRTYDAKDRRRCRLLFQRLRKVSGPLAKVVGALTLLAPSFRMLADRLEQEIIPSLREGAEILSFKYGHARM